MSKVLDLDALVSAGKMTEQEADDLFDSLAPPPMAKVCSWCETEIEPGTDPPSHTICGECLHRERSKL